MALTFRTIALLFLIWRRWRFSAGFVISAALVSLLSFLLVGGTEMQAFARSLGIDCAAMKYIAVKSAAHFRSGFERLGGPIFNVNAPAMHSHDYKQLAYHRLFFLQFVDGEVNLAA